MIAPGCIVILSPLVFGWLLGYDFVSGMLTGVITSGIQIAFSASNTGGAWDNCKKFIEKGSLKWGDNKRPAGTFKAGEDDFYPIKKNAHTEHGSNVDEFYGKDTVVAKKTEPHKAAVIGDTVGDPLKDTSGPSINILIKLMAITSLVFGSFIYRYGGVLKKATEDTDATDLL